ncbi:hypothetical protein HDU87_002168 [Geranomyces variabilis]|uniref:Calcineurin-like phosphoesterase domain-containing protein n=1 Tax=Geranomyces variabilis TaxID=109894 RepID=A0AAD5TLU9_9FUNG|nr:hypothetical protein HDU87_002168 [Geranomyces variabilis]
MWYRNLRREAGEKMEAMQTTDPSFQQYHIGPTSCVTRFAARLKKLRAQYPDSLTVFSGDAFAPSVEATVLRGQHMVPVLNALGVDIAAFGNHDFDFGEPTAKALGDACTFPWLMSNVEGEAGRAIGGAAQSWTVDRNGVRIGFFALAGTDWPSNCQNFPHDVRFLDPVAVAARMVAQLRGPAGPDVVVALTHMRLPEDQLVLATCPGIDLVLGGHDHAPVVISNPAAASPCFIVKSGMDFQHLSVVRMRVDCEVQPAVTVTVETHSGFGNTSLEEDPDLKTVVGQVASQMSTLIDRNLLRSDVNLEGRSMVVRTEETNLGNLFADILRAYYQCHIAFLLCRSVTYLYFAAYEVPRFSKRSKIAWATAAQMADSSNCPVYPSPSTCPAHTAIAFFLSSSREMAAPKRLLLIPCAYIMLR